MVNVVDRRLLSKASKTKSWLWHRRLSHLNFGTLNKLAKDGLARGIPRLKFQKDHLCSACALGKSKKSSHQPKVEDTNQEKLYLLHMDLCGPIRMASINRKKYILVIVNNYSRFTWVRFLKTKDEALAAIIKLHISQSPRGIFIKQSKYAFEIVKKYGLHTTDSVDTPMVEKNNLDEDLQGKQVDATLYRGMIGSLMYLTSSRPDLIYDVCLCARIRLSLPESTYKR
ncbi:retrovirus-related pol polyprotein from transposon TNT 1-94 [Tanacetum coccineum]